MFEFIEILFYHYVFRIQENFSQMKKRKRKDQSLPPTLNPKVAPHAGHWAHLSFAVRGQWHPCTTFLLRDVACE